MGGVQKSRMLRAYGLRDTRLYRYRRPLFTLFTWYTRVRYRQLARHVVNEIEQHRDGGVEVIGPGSDHTPCQQNRQRAVAQTDRGGSRAGR
jgi:hypothetical protein